MREQKRSIVRRICLLAGICMLAAAALTMVSWQRGMRVSQQQAADYVHTLRTLLPESQSAFPEERSNNAMPVLSLDGTDFIGILEMPRYGSALPVCADWGRVSQHPCRFDGSIYDGTLQIGGSSQRGQYDFYREISVGDSVYFTDMQGKRYAYAVTGLHYAKHADQAALQREEADLTLFIKNAYSFEYIIISCDVSS